MTSRIEKIEMLKQILAGKRSVQDLDGQARSVFLMFSKDIVDGEFVCKDFWESYENPFIKINRAGFNITQANGVKINQERFEQLLHFWKTLDPAVCARLTPDQVDLEYDQGLYFGRYPLRRVGEIYSPEQIEPLFDLE